MLPARSRQLLFVLIGVQIVLGAMDLVAVGLVGALGTLATALIQSQSIGPTGNIGRLLRALHLESFSQETQVVLLAAATVLIFVGRTVLSIYLTRRALRYLANRAADASVQLVDGLLSQNLHFIQRHNTQDLIFSTTASTNALVLGVLGSVVSMASDAAMLLVLSIFLIYAAPLVALVSALLLIMVVSLLHRSTVTRAHELGTRGASLDIESREMLYEAIATYRDMYVRGAQQFYSRTNRRLRQELAGVAAESAFLPNISKYVLESAVILGALVVAGVEFAVEDSQRAVGILTLFLAAGTRLAPGIVRLQQGATSLRLSSGQAEHALGLRAELLENPKVMPPTLESFNIEHTGFVPSVELIDVSFKYPNSEKLVVENLSLWVEPGSFVALTGPSGAGKSSVADLILGILDPDRGSVRISGFEPKWVLGKWPGAIGYVPQEVWITDGTIRENVCLGMDPSLVADELVWKVLNLAALEEYVRELPGTLDAEVGERGTRLSGGQRQRLGIARALLTNPKLIVLDEATSNLDAGTESLITQSLQALRGKVTLIAVAHRLATVKSADIVVYMENARICDAGTFNEVRQRTPNFARLAELSQE